MWEYQTDGAVRSSAALSQNQRFNQVQPGLWKGLSRFATLSFGMFTVGMFGEIVGSLDL